MKIESITLYHITQKLVAPFATSFGSEQDRPCILIKMQSDGLTAWGECVTGNEPGYCYETVETAWHIATKFIIPRLLGKELNEPEEIQSFMSYVRGHPLAKAGFDQAAWDLTAQRDGVSFAEKLAQPLGVAPRKEVEVGVSIGIQPIPQTIETIAGYVEQGYGRIKLKIKPGHDVGLTQAARKAFPEMRIMLDANSAYSLADSALLAALDELELLMLEQPLGYDDIYEHSLLKPRIGTPLCLDECIKTFSEAQIALAIDACDIINIKPGRVGGWTVARQIHNLCYDAGIPVWVGGMLETGVGRAGQLALAALPGFTLPGDISATERYYHEDVATHFTLNKENSAISVPATPGLGVEVNLKRLQETTIRSEQFVAE